MSRRGWRIALTAALVAAALVLGRVLVQVLADAWWVRATDPAAVPGRLRLEGLRLLLDATGVVCSVLWFTLNLLLVLRLVERVEIPRYLANLEFRETVRPGSVRWLALALAVLLGTLTGLGLGGLWREVVLWGGGLQFGLRDPVLARDLATYVVQLPLLEGLHAWAWRVVTVTLVTVVLAYAAIGAIRRTARRVSIAPSARRHLAALLALVAVVIGMGFLLRPALALAGGTPLPGLTAWRVLAIGNSAMLGVALGVAAISLGWAARARGSFVAAGWIVLALAVLTERSLLPAVIPPGPALIADDQRRALDAAGWSLQGVDQRPAEQADLGGPTLLWEEALVRLTFLADSTGGRLLGPTELPGSDGPRPAWMAMRESPDGGAELVALAADTVTAAGGPLSWRRDDPERYPGLLAYAPLPTTAVHPGAGGILRDSVMGVPLGGTLRRAVLAWALQEPDLLGSGPGEERAEWRRTPGSRLGGLVPWVEWGEPRLVLTPDDSWWVSIGTVAYSRFPAARPIEGKLGAEAGLIGAVRATDGAVRVAVLHGAGPVTRRLAEFAGTGLVPPDSLPARVRLQAPYPLGLFAAQVASLGQPHWGTGRPVPARASRTDLVLNAAGIAIPTAAFEDSAGHAVSGLLVGRMDAGVPMPVLLRTPGDSLPGPLALEARWRRFPVFEQLSDSASGAGGSLEPGMVHYRIRDNALHAWQAWWGVSGQRRPALRWVTVARAGRLGAGRTEAEAWANLEGTRVPLGPGASPGTRLDEVRDWFQRAEAALRRGDWDGFGRALDAMRTLLEPPAADSVP